MSDDDGHALPDQSSRRASHVAQNTADPSTLSDDASNSLVPSDLWSAAYREAVEGLGKDIDVAILMGSNVAQLFKQLEEIDKEATRESAFVRGVAYLRSIQVPLERFKLALDLASPLSSIEPTATTVIGVVRGVTAVRFVSDQPRPIAALLDLVTYLRTQIAISFATADLEFAKQIGEMLEQIAYIDDCDTLGQRANKLDIHKVNCVEYFDPSLKLDRHSCLCTRRSLNSIKSPTKSLPGEDGNW